MFRSAYNNKTDKNYSMGEYTHYHNEYGIIIDKDGKSHPGVIGKTNLQQKKREAKDSCLLSSIIKRFVNGDESAVGKVNGGFIDLTNMPTDLMGMHATLVCAEDKFNKLDLETRKKYGNNFTNYLADYENIVKEQLEKAQSVKDRTVVKEDKEDE